MLKKKSFLEAVVRRCPVKKLFLRISQNSQENTCARVSFLIKKRLRHRCFPVNFAKFPRTPFIIEHLWWLLPLFDKINDTKNALFFHSQALTHDSATFNLRFLYELNHKVCLSKIVCGIFHF